MKSRFRNLGTAGRWAIVALLAGFIGCTSAGMHRRPTLSDDLPAGVDRDPSRFRQQLTGFRGIVTHLRSRPALCYPGWQPGCTVDIEIEVGDVELPNPDVPPRQGKAVARIANRDARDIEAYYYLVPRSQAEFYVWIDNIPGTQRTRWTLLYVPAGAGNVQTAFAKPLRRCHTRPAGDPATYPFDVDFAEFKHPPDGGTCAVAMEPVERSVALGSVFSIRPLAAVITRMTALISGRAARAGPIWYECNGCCT